MTLLLTLDRKDLDCVVLKFGVNPFTRWLMVALNVAVQPRDGWVPADGHLDGQLAP